MRKNFINIFLFLAAAGGLYFLLSYAEKNWLQQPPKNTKKDEPSPEETKKHEEERALREAKHNAAAAVAGNAAIAIAPTRHAELVKTPDRITTAAALASNAAVVFSPKPPLPTLISLGDSSFYLQVLLNTQGGGVQQVVLPKFEEADRLGRQMKGVPLYLIPGVPRVRMPYLADNYPVPDLKPGKTSLDTALAEPSYTIFHYPTPDDKFPDPKLGDMEWKVVSEEHPEGGEHKVVFEAELGEPYFVKFRKTYSLAPKDYHIGLKLDIERLPGGQKGKGQLRYQISGPRGLPVEGEWYNNTYRVALTGWTDRKGRPGRQYDTALNIGIMWGGDATPRGENTFKYMAIATQYFASALAIDDKAAEGSAKNPWSYVRATREVPFNKSVDMQRQPFLDDISIRAASETLDLGPGEKTTHSYLIYNGPAKVKLLGLMEGDRAVDDTLVKRYTDSCGLKTITDFHSPTWLGSFADTIYWTDLVIAFTNVMHWFMALIHSVIPSWAVCIIVLTVIVRLLLMYPSKKQTQMNVRMMEIQKKLAPQFEELKKKYADDFHGYNRAKMQLMMAHGVNPLAQMGGCLLLLLQMPIMMGLYFCLQESVFFRLEPFLWINNLAAPDMTLWWSEKIPYVSTPDNLGGIIYLGPYFNILPILAIVLMFWQQLKMLPPATDDQSRQQRMMMKIMMFVMPIFFYKFAAGLALYFIIGTVWGLVERRIIKKADEAKAAELAANPAAAKAGETDAPPKPKGWWGRFKDRLRERYDEMKRQADEQSKRQIRNDRNAPPNQNQSQNKNQSPTSGQRPEPGQNSNQDRRDDRRKKKKRKR
jgi:YidC/Oxa1 family membrane protein insertase